MLSAGTGGNDCGVGGRDAIKKSYIPGKEP